MKENKAGIVAQLSEATDWEEEKPSSSRCASSLEVSSASEDFVAQKQTIKKELQITVLWGLVGWNEFQLIM